jgi:hypothetical protein
MMSNRLRALVVAAVLAASFASVRAQVISRETPVPARTAAGTDWYASREPLFLMGAVYEPAGASVFFNGNTMFPFTTFDGVELYQDATLEPHSIVYVPIGRGLVQPYERRRSGDLAGTTGSRAPSFPVASPGDVEPAREALTEQDLAVPVGTSGDYSTRDEGCVPCECRCSPAAEVVSTSAAVPTAVAAPAGPLRTAKQPEGNRGLWVPFEGHVYVADGQAEAFDAGTFAAAGQYAGFTVYRRAVRDDRIYIPSVDGGLLAPYRRTETVAP